MGEFTETKERIFDTFIEMSSELGYESVTIRDLAKKVGINSSSIYYHYESKERILEHVYEYYARHYFDNRKPIEMMKELIREANAEEFTLALTRDYQTSDRKKYVRMILITKIIYMRLFQDAAANKMFAENNANDTEYVMEILRHGIEIGRIQSDFDIEAFAGVLIGSMIALGVEAFSRSNYKVGQLDYEARRRAMLSRLYASALL